MNSLSEQIDWDKVAGLVPAIVQDAITGRVLMLGYMNSEALAQTTQTGLVTFFSRSKQRLWTKGESSGNTLQLRQIQLDCDFDAILITATPAGPTCHLDKVSCFGDELEQPGFGFIGLLETIIAQRISDGADDSYTHQLTSAGTQRIAKKVGEEGVEVALAAAAGSREETVSEAADLIFHLLLLLKSRQLNIEDVAGELIRRHDRA